jgi:hypothetical protein
LTVEFIFQKRSLKGHGMSRTVAGNKVAGYTYWAGRCSKCDGTGTGADIKRFTHKRERLQSRHTARIEADIFELDRDAPPILTEQELAEQALANSDRDYGEICDMQYFVF